jgi:hypothetical protein
VAKRSAWFRSVLVRLLLKCPHTGHKSVADSIKNYGTPLATSPGQEKRDASDETSFTFVIDDPDAGNGIGAG